MRVPGSLSGFRQSPPLLQQTQFSPMSHTPQNILHLLGLAKSGVAVIMDIAREALGTEKFEFYPNLIADLQPDLPVHPYPYFIHPVDTPIPKDKTLFFAVSTTEKEGFSSSISKKCTWGVISLVGTMPVGVKLMSTFFFQSL